TRVIHNFIRYPFLAERVVEQRHIQPGTVLLAGRLDAGKGFGEFLAQAEGWLPPHAQLTVIGDGPLRASLEARYAGPRVRFLGWRPYDEVIRAAARSHLCVVPSVLEEPCATTILEALALGKPCIALARGGTPELAAYQYYDGQLRLADDMPQLVGIMAEQLAQAPRAVVLPSSVATDVFRAIPNILDVYAE
ncbi:MAG TPA: glycosyltransferase family 4 protein, partial [Telluria sp.]